MLVLVYILLIGLLVLAQLMQSYASCLLPSLLRCCSCLLCLLFLCRSLLVPQLFHRVSLSTVLGFCSLFYTVHFLQCMLGWLICTVHAGIACLTFLTCDWPQMHAGIACLPSLIYDWVTACWNRLFILLHAGIACLASLACDWVIACWDSLAALCMLG